MRYLVIQPTLLSFILSSLQFTVIIAGTYFAAHAPTSYGYCRPSVQGARVQMFVSMVLAGRCGPGQSGLRRPPAGYDSVGGGDAVVVVFDRMQCYPKYVIQVCMKR